MNMEELTSTFLSRNFAWKKWTLTKRWREKKIKQLYWVNGECHKPFHPCDDGMSLGWNKPQNLFYYIHNLDVPSLEH